MSVLVPCRSFRLVLFCCCIAVHSVSGDPNSTSNSSLVTPVAKVTTILQDMKAKSTQLKQSADLHIADVRTACTGATTQSNSDISAAGIQIGSLTAYIQTTETEVNQLIDSIADHEQEIADNEVRLKNLRTTREADHLAYQRDLGELDVTIAAIKRAEEIIQVQQTVSSSASSSFLQIRRARIGDAAVQALRSVRAAVTGSSLENPQTNFSKDASQIFSDFDSLTTATKAYEANAGSIPDILANLKQTIEGKKQAAMAAETNAKNAFVQEEAALVGELTNDKTDLVADKEARAEKDLDLLRKKSDLKQYQETKVAVEAYLQKVTTKCAKQEADYSEMNTLRTQEIQALDKAITFILSLQSGGNFLQLPAETADNVAHLALPVPGINSSTGSPTQNMAGFIRLRAAQLSSISLRKLAKRVAALAAGRAKDDPLAEVKQMIADLIVKLQKDAVQDKEKNEWCTQQLAQNEASRTSAKTSIEKTTARLKKTQGDLEVVESEITSLNTSYDASIAQRATMVQERESEKTQNEQAIGDADESGAAVDAAMTILKEYYQNVSKVYGFFYQRHTKQVLTHARNETGPNITVPDELPSDLAKEAPESVSLEAGNSVVSMLEVVRDRYKGIASRLRTQESEAQQLYVESLRDLDAKIAAMEEDRKGKQELQADYLEAVPAHNSDLQGYTQALQDSEANYENLKGPCLNADDGEQRRQQLQGEIDALKEAERMIEDFMNSFIQTSGGQSAKSRVQSAATVGDIAEVIRLLEQIKTEVLADIQSDQATYNTMSTWCTNNINSISNAINTHNNRDTELVNMIEVSAQQKAQLEIEAKNLESEKSQALEALAQHATLRTKDLEAFRQNEKELVQSIKSLDSAIVVLSAHYEKAETETTRDLEAERADALAAKASLNISLVNVVGQVAKALKSMPASEMNAAMNLNSPDSTAILQAFFANPLDLLRHKRATLTQTSAQLSDGVDGNTVMGILKQLLETFKADLAAAQQSESGEATSFTSQQTAKQAEINALTSSIGTKQEQLAHYVSVNAQAKEDLAYLREIRTSDVAYLTQLKTQCAQNDIEYEQRSALRQSELKAINEGILMLEADDSNTGGGNFLLHSQAQPSGDQQVMFVHHRQPVNRILLKVGKGHAPTSTSQNVTRVVQVVKRAKAATRHGNISSAGLLGHSLLQRKLMRSNASGFQIHRSTGREALHALREKAKLALRQRASGVADDAFKIVISQLDAVHSQLKRDKQLESTMKDTCLEEKATSTREQERRQAEQGLLESEKGTLETHIGETETAISDLGNQIDELNASLTTALIARNQEHEVFKTSVEKELQKQAKLQKAIQTLKDFYASKGIIKLVQRSKRVHRTSAPNSTDALENVTKYDRLNKSSVKAAERLDIPNATVFEKPVRPHAGSKGIIGIIALLIEESQHIVEQIVEDEEYGADAYNLDVQKTNRAIEDLKQQRISQNSVLANANSNLQDTKDEIVAVMNEIAAIIAYIQAVNTKCNTLVANFDANQAARQAEIDDIFEARNALATQVEGGVPQPSA